MNLRHLTNSRLAALACVLFLVIALSACVPAKIGVTRDVPVPAGSYPDHPIRP